MRMSGCDRRAGRNSASMSTYSPALCSPSPRGGTAHLPRRRGRPHARRYSKERRRLFRRKQVMKLKPPLGCSPLRVRSLKLCPKRVRRRLIHRCLHRRWCESGNMGKLDPRQRSAARLPEFAAPKEKKAPDDRRAPRAFNPAVVSAPLLGRLAEDGLGRFGTYVSRLGRHCSLFW
jgi:hypothetical protein